MPKMQNCAMGNILLSAYTLFMSSPAGVQAYKHKKSLPHGNDQIALAPKPATVANENPEDFYKPMLTDHTAVNSAK
ncbi:hypothetical protein [Paenibacillus tengchongensis]|uniref:hypothetical protein n=1 Tax=Paenibacillus tengchongensis TaxID=2608684 RepID=UPI001C9E2E6B|nr:hypothetical protein [Paenibacillus tengchongensis]